MQFSLLISPTSMVMMSVLLMLLPVGSELYWLARPFHTCCSMFFLKEWVVHSLCLRNNGSRRNDVGSHATILYFLICKIQWSYTTVEQDGWDAPNRLTSWGQTPKPALFFKTINSFKWLLEAYHYHVWLIMPSCSSEPVQEAAFRFPHPESQEKSLLISTPRWSDSKGCE